MAEVNIKEILNQDVEIPGIVNDKMQEAYNMLDKTKQGNSGNIKYYLARHKKIYATAVVFCIIVIVTFVDWNSIYIFAKNIFVKQEEYIGGNKLELPEISYINGKFPEDTGNTENNAYQNSKWYNSLAEIEKDFGITLLKNSMADGQAHNSKGILASFGRYCNDLEYYDGRVDISALFYITKGMKPVYNKDGIEAGHYQIIKEDYVSLDLDITCYINPEKTYKGERFEAGCEDKIKFVCYYEDDTVGTVAIWKNITNGNIYAKFVYKDILYQLNGNATTEQLKEAVAAFYE